MPNFLVRALRNDFAEVQHINLVANLLDQRHVVFDHQHAQAVAAQMDDLLAEFMRLDRIHACCRLIEQNQLRLNRQRARHLQSSLIAIRQRSGLHSGGVRQVEAFQQHLSILTQFAFFAAVAARENQRVEQAGPPARVLADQQVVECRHIAEQPDILVGAGDAQPGDGVRRKVADIALVEADLAAGRVI